MSDNIKPLLLFLGICFLSCSSLNSVDFCSPLAFQESALNGHIGASTLIFINGQFWEAVLGGREQSIPNCKEEGFFAACDLRGADSFVFTDIWSQVDCITAPW